MRPRRTSLPILSLLIAAISVPGASGSTAVDPPEWRIEELALAARLDDSAAAAARLVAAGRPIAFAMADFRHDGRPDLAVLYRGALVLFHDVREAAARGDGEVRADLTEIPGTIDYLAAGDFDADGRQDLVLAARGDWELHLLAGGQDGFAPARSIDLPGRILGLAAGEMNRGDGLEELALAVEAESGPRALLFEGPGGALARPPESVALPTRPREILFGRVDGDAWDDLVLAGERRTVVIYGRDRRLSFDRGSRGGEPGPRIAVLRGLREPLPGRLPGQRKATAAARSGPVLTARIDGDAIDDYVTAAAGGARPVILLSAPVATYTVDSTGDGGDANTGDGACDDGSGSCTLRAAIEQANASSGMDAIEFGIGGGGAQTITLGSVLPTVTEAVEIDGTTQPGYAGTPLVTVDGNGLGGSGLEIIAGGSTVTGLAIGGFGGSGIRLTGGAGNVVTACSISGNGLHGIDIQGSPGNTIGGTTAAERNLISGNTGDGIHMSGSGSTGNVIQGNYIGVNSAGTGALPNEDGIDLSTGPTSNTIGGTAAGAGNLVSGNSENGVELEESGAGNLVQGNRIGTDAAGTAAVANGENGVELKNSPSSTVGGTAAGAGNLVSGNTDDGVHIGPDDAGGIGNATGNLVQGNLIGTDTNGTSAIANGDDGVDINGGATNTVGGTAAGARNVIAGNDDNGVLIRTAFIPAQGGDNNAVQGNYIGVDAGGAVALANDDGVKVNGPTNTIGGAAAGAGNVISGNTKDGVNVCCGGADTVIEGNSIGTNAAGTAGVGNGDDGVEIRGLSGCRVGGTDPGAGNLISGNADNGILLAIEGFTSTPATDTLIQGNLIGTDASGTAALGNGQTAPSGDGIEITGSDDNTIGGLTAAARNVISGNLKEGVYIHNGSEGNKVQGNYIGTNAAGTAAVPNASDGVDIRETSGNTVGGTEAGAGNLISGNAGGGVEVAGRDGDTTPTPCAGLAAGASPYTGNIIQGNAIGTTADRLSALANIGNGVEIEWADDTVIGGAAAGAGNLIAYNTTDGIDVFCGSQGTMVEGNTITANGDDGVVIRDRAFDSTVSGNSIHANAGQGIDLDDDGVTANDPGDADGGANGRQNFPVLTSVTSGSTTVEGSLDSSASTTFDIEIFSVAACDAAGNGEGEVFLGGFQVTTLADGSATFDETLAPDVPAGHVVTATATDPAGNTSEFSACVTPAVCADLEVTDLAVTTALTKEACATLYAGPSVTVEGPSGDLTLRGRTVVLRDDVSVLSGAALTVENTP